MKLLKKLNFLFRKKKEDITDQIDELIEYTEDSHGNQVDSDERALIENVLNLRSLTAEDIMIPRADIVASSINEKPENIIKTMLKNNLSFLPIFSDTLDHIIGVLDIKDVTNWLMRDKNIPVEKLVKDVLFISPTMLIIDLMVEMRETGQRIAFIVDEFGGIDGLVTFSNIISEIVGDIELTERGALSQQVHIHEDGTVEADGRVPLEELQELLGEVPMLKTDDEDIDTIGGLVVFLAGRVPVGGEVVAHPNGGEFVVLKADPRRVHRLKMRQ